MPSGLNKRQGELYLLFLCIRFFFLLAFFVAERQVMQQVLLFGGMDHQKSQFCAMHVDLDGEQREHLQTTPLYMPVQTLLTLSISKFLK